MRGAQGRNLNKPINGATYPTIPINATTKLKTNTYIDTPAPKDT
jgi:hypothetical protein